MVCQKVVINIKFGLHARPAGVLAKLAQQYQSDIQMKVNGKTVNVKSVMGVMSAGVQCGTEVEFICSGADEWKALHDTANAVQAGLGEK
jgi:Phosphotransferase System HPr (HPr) Family